MKKNDFNKKKKVFRVSRSISLVACMVFTGLSLSYSYGQVVTGQKTTTTQQVSTQKTTTPRQVTVTRLQMKPVKVSASELRTIKESNPAKNFTSTQTLTTSQKSAGVQPINVSWPEDQQVWIAVNEYPIHWSGAGNDVKIDLVFLGTAGRPRTKYPITSQAPNTGNYFFRIPDKWVKEPADYKVVIETVDGKQSGASQGTISVYTQPIDLECRVVAPTLKWKDKNYIVYRDKKKWIEFNVLMRNKGLQSPVTITQVLVKIIKQPENVVVTQEEWGFSGIYNHDWYHLSEPRKIEISSIEGIPFFDDRKINYEAGYYRVEIELDPQNNLGEMQDLRYDNKDWQPWKLEEETNPLDETIRKHYR